MELIYARWLSACTRAGLALLAIAFFIYMTGLADVQIPLERLPELWRLPLQAYLAQSGAPTGWRWVGLAVKADYANVAAIAALGLVTAVCYARLLATLMRRGEHALALVAVLQIAVLLVAASGALTAGH
jgi:hypothetical protein